MASIRDLAVADWDRIVSDPDGFGTSIKFTAPTSEVATIVGLATKHHISIDGDGLPINSKNAHISVPEKRLVDAGYPVRGVDGEVDMNEHQVEWSDSTGLNKVYTIQEQFPDETVGILTFIIGDSSE